LAADFKQCRCPEAVGVIGCINPGWAAPHSRGAGHGVGVARGCGAATATLRARHSCTIGTRKSIRDTVPPPKPVEVDPGRDAADERSRDFAMLVSRMDWLPALGPTVTGKVGVTREPMKKAMAGDIVSSSVTGFIPKWTQTLASHARVASPHCVPIDPPVIAARVHINDSPLVGKDGKHITMLEMGG